MPSHSVDSKNSCQRVPYSMTGELIMSLTYGIEVSTKDDPYVSMSEHALSSFAIAGNAGSALGEFAVSQHVYIILTRKYLSS